MSLSRRFFTSSVLALVAWVACWPAPASAQPKAEGVLVYVGTYNSGASKISMPILNRANLLMISPANTWPGLTKPGHWDPGEPEIYRPTGKVTSRKTCHGFAPSISAASTSSAGTCARPA